VIPECCDSRMRALRLKRYLWVCSNIWEYINEHTGLGWEDLYRFKCANGDVMLLLLLEHAVDRHAP
jgi:hypothetical protein